jgi:hypothetical protein
MKSKLTIKSTNSWFGEYAHRNPEAALPMMYVMACIEIVSCNSTRAKTIYNDIVKAWGNPGVQELYDKLISEFSDEEKGYMENMVRNPELAFEGDVNKPWNDIVSLVSKPDFENIAFTGTWKQAFDTLDTKYQDVWNLFCLMFDFIFEGFNRESDIKERKFKVIPSVEPPWLLNMIMYRTLMENKHITLDRLIKIYKVREYKGKTYNFEHILTQHPNNRMHRRLVAAGKGTNMKLHHDYKYLDAAWLWYQCRIIYQNIDDFLDAEEDKGNHNFDYKNVQKQIKICDDALGYMKRAKHIKL